MNITKIELLNFRNYNKKIFRNLKKINMIIGTNGSGKTSILESIYICSIGKSFRTNIDSSIVNEKSSNYKIKISTKENKITTKLELLYNRKGKKTKINNNQTRKLSEFIGKYKTVLFSPDEVKLIKDSPSCRRSYLNIQLSQLEKKYLKYLNDYNLLIKNKNDYLKKLCLNGNLDQKYLDVIDDKIVELGIKIFNYRKKYIEEINESLKQISKKNKIELEYYSDFDKTEKEIKKKIKSVRNKDIMLGMTIFGIHRDDITFLFNNNNSKEYSSQGQQKMIILFLKLAEVDIFMNKYNYKPILLLDDLFSELDKENQNLIINKLSKKTQIFITATDVKNIDHIKKINIINLNGMEAKNERK